jgi:hypothetical protein
LQTLLLNKMLSAPPVLLWPLQVAAAAVAAAVAAAA